MNGSKSGPRMTRRNGSRPVSHANPRTTNEALQKENEDPRYCHPPAQLVTSRLNIPNVPASSNLRMIDLSSTSSLSSSTSLPSSSSTTTSTASSSSTSSATSKQFPARPCTESWRDTLSAYITDPTLLQPHASPTLRHTANSITIRHPWPKATVHLLVLPLCPSKTRLHPFSAFDDPAFLALVRAECAQAKKLAAHELRAKFGRHSAADKRIAAGIEGRGRDWAASIRIGVHAAPAMANLHIHVMSRDLCIGGDGGGKESQLKNAERYNRFHSAFFVPLADFPLAADDPRRWPDRQGYLTQELECWKCKERFGRDLERFKRHLEAEAEGFKRL